MLNIFFLWIEGLSCLTWILTKDFVRRTVSEISTECAPVFSHSMGLSLGFHCVAVSCLVTTKVLSALTHRNPLWQYDPIPFPECVRWVASPGLVRVCGNSTNEYDIGNSFLSPGKVFYSSVVEHGLFVPLWKWLVAVVAPVTCGTTSVLHLPDRSVINLHCNCLPSPPEHPFTKITF